MSAASDYLENQIINHMLRNQAFSPPSPIYVALFLASTGLEANTIGTASEVSGGSYVRKAVTLAAPGTPGTTSNSADVDFGIASANWGTVTHFAIMDGATAGAGNILIWGALTTSKTVNNGDGLKFPTGTLVVNVA